MASYSYERLSAQDASFLWAESPNQPMHVGAVAIYEAEALTTAEGSIDIERLRARVESVLHWIPRYRQKLAWTPIEGWPVWIDDRQFEIGNHIRHIALPRPGSAAQLGELAARINARRLDRRHALWEIWVIEGVAGGEQFAMLNKIHHCMIDGAAGTDLSQILMSPSPRDQPTEIVPYLPRRAPSPGELLRDSVALGLRRPFDLLKSAAESSARSIEESLNAETADRDAKDDGAVPRKASFEQRLRSMRNMLGSVTGGTSSTPLNGELGPHRRFEWLTMPLEDVKEVRRVFGCTINDVVLTTVTEAVRRYLFRRRVDPRRISFRVAAPVSTRRPEHDRRQGNHVSTWVVPLPLALEDPVEQLDAIRETTQDLKTSQASLAFETLMDWAEWIPAPLLSRGIGALHSAGPVNMIVTNVPGPSFPLYMAGAKLHALYPIVPLLPGGGLGVALFSYEGKLCWGFNGDFELIPDLNAFMQDVQIAFERLRSQAVQRFMARRTSQTQPTDSASTSGSPPDVTPNVPKLVLAHAGPPADEAPGASQVRST